MMTWLPIIVLLTGLVLYMLGASRVGKLETVGLWMFVCALVGLMVAMAPASMKLFH